MAETGTRTGTHMDTNRDTHMDMFCQAWFVHSHPAGQEILQALWGSPLLLCPQWGPQEPPLSAPVLSPLQS